MSKYIPTIGLEIHAELKTKTKMFCDCLNNPQEKHPNQNVCPICMGSPGTLPVINKEAVRKVLKIGMALGGDIPQFTKFDRKNYFYPDLPKAYQISQYDLPLVSHGMLKGIKLTRIHLEEDTGRLIHATSDKGHETSSKRQASLVDFNRAGVPLMELVTEPDIKTADQAIEFARELQLILRYLDVSDADMEKGQLRVEANVSIRPNADADKRGQRKSRINADDINDDRLSNQRGSVSLGTKVELKNINSFKAVHDAIEYETKRQAEVLDSAKKVIQETRGWDEKKKQTFSQRLKEEAHDYRYFPEPDLPPLNMGKFDLAELKREIPELPQAKRVRLQKEFGITSEQAEALVANERMAQFFEESISELESEDKKNVSRETNLIFNYLTSDLKGLMIEQGIGFGELKINSENFADLIELISHGKITSRVAKNLLRKMQETGADPHVILADEGLEQISDESELLKIVKKIIENNPKPVEDFKKGKEAALKFLTGQAMRELKGKGNPQILQKIFKSELK